MLSSVDFHRDSVVDAFGYVVWRKNGSGQADYNTWRTNFGAAAGSGSGVHADSSANTAVPEPASILLLT